MFVLTEYKNYLLDDIVLSFSSWLSPVLDAMVYLFWTWLRILLPSGILMCVYIFLFSIDMLFYALTNIWWQIQNKTKHRGYTRGYMYRKNIFFPLRCDTPPNEINTQSKSVFEVVIKDSLQDEMFRTYPLYPPFSPRPSKLLPIGESQCHLFTCTVYSCH